MFSKKISFKKCVTEANQYIRNDMPYTGIVRLSIVIHFIMFSPQCVDEAHLMSMSGTRICECSYTQLGLAFNRWAIYFFGLISNYKKTVLFLTDKKWYYL